MSSRLSGIAPKLEKLVLMLSSDQPGEVAAAAAAINRTLQTVGADWHDLAQELTKPSPAPPRDEYSRSRNEGQDDWRPLHKYCRSHAEELSAREQDFMDTLSRWRGNITEKQRAWLEAIHARLRREETQ
jgi:hypothetical protein